MFPSSTSIATRAGSLIRRWRDDTRGIAAVEFALIVPVMAVMFIGMVELSQAITVSRRVTQIASSTADLVARADKTISQTEVRDIMRAGSYIMKPSDTKPLKIILRNVTSSPASALIAKQTWSCTYIGATDTQTCACSNTTYNLPSNLVTTNDSVVVAEVTYTYAPQIFDYFLKIAFAGGAYTMAETTYLKPRSQRAMLLQTDNVTPCANPTF